MRETRKHVTFDVGGKTYEAELRGKDWSERRYAKAKGFCWGPGDDREPSKEFRFLAEHIGAPSVYTSRGDFPALDKAFDKMNREIVAAKREVFEAALKALGFEFAKGQVKFSRKAGCSCGCSPGFILDVPGILWGETVFVNPVKK
jgi:hypothetical protein